MARNHKTEYKKIYRSETGGAVKSVDMEKRQITITGTSEAIDRDGDIISVNGWKIDNYLKNPVFLWAHNYDVAPIGAATKVIKKRNPSRLDFVIQFPSKGVYPFADMVLDLFNEKILNAASVGFIGQKIEPLNKEDIPGHDGPVGYKFFKQELLELSAVPVPSNPEALQNSIKRYAGENTEDWLKCWIFGETAQGKDIDIIKEVSKMTDRKAVFIDDSIDDSIDTDKKSMPEEKKDEIKKLSGRIDALEKEVKLIASEIGKTKDQVEIVQPAIFSIDKMLKQIGL